MYNRDEILGPMIGGILVFTILIGLGSGLWALLNYDFVVTASLVVLYGLGQMIYTHIKYPKNDWNTKWFVFWFENQWYKLVLLLTGMRAFLLWV